MQFLKILGIQAGNDQEITLASIRAIWIVTAVAFCFSVIAAFVIATRVMPLTDGWYEALIFLKSKGLQPYRDIEFVLPPMTPLFFSLLNAVSGENIAIHKILGVVLSVFNAGLVYIWGRRKNGPIESFVASFAFFLLETTFPVYLARDYHSLVNLFAIPCMFLMIDRPYAESRKLNVQWVLLAALAGVFAQLLFLTKQNVGLLVIAGFSAFLASAAIIHAARSHRLKTGLPQALYLLAFLAATAVTGILFIKFYVPAIPVPDFYKAIMHVETKGSMLYAATRVVHDKNNVQIIVAALAIAVPLTLFAQMIDYLEGRSLPYLKKLPAAIHDGLAIGAFSIVAFIIWRLVVKENAWTGFDFFAVVTLVFYLLDCFHVFGVFGKKTGFEARAFGRILVFGSLIFANTLTASINIIGTMMLFVYYLAQWFGSLIRWLPQADTAWLRMTTFGILLAVSILAIKLETMKLSEPYAWWGISEPPIPTSDASSAQKILVGMRLNSRRARLIDNLVEEITASTAPSDPILVYPNMPVLYMLSDRLPVTHSYVQWFDFARTATLADDFAKVSAAPPKIIVEMVLPPLVYHGHEELLGHRLIQHSFADYLQCMVNHEAFLAVDTQLYSQSERAEEGYVLEANTPVNAEQIFKLAATAHEKFGDIDVLGAYVGNSRVSVKKMVDSRMLYSSIVVQGDSAKIPDLIRVWRESSGLEFSLLSNVVVRVLKRTDEWSKRGTPCQETLTQQLALARKGL